MQKWWFLGRKISSFGFVGNWVTTILLAWDWIGLNFQGQRVWGWSWGITSQDVTWAPQHYFDIYPLHIAARDVKSLKYSVYQKFLHMSRYYNLLLVCFHVSLVDRLAWHISVIEAKIAVNEKGAEHCRGELTFSSNCWFVHIILDSTMKLTKSKYDKNNSLENNDYSTTATADFNDYVKHKENYENWE